MSIQILEQRHYVEKIKYFRSYAWLNNSGTGFSFPSDEEGNVSSSVEQQENYQYCEKYIKKGLMKVDVIKLDHSHWELARAQCHCGCIIWLDGDTYCEKCGRWYNSVGQEIQRVSPFSGMNECGEYYSAEDY
jgi:hypothetical protein